MPSRPRKSKPSDIVGRFAVRLRELRLAQGMTQFDLSNRAGVSLAFVGRLEAGAASCTVEVLDKIAKALAVNIADLLPTSSPPDTTVQLRERVRSLADRLVQKADQQTLSLAAQLLARLNDR